MIVVGVIADTHGLLRPQALEALRGCDRLVHAGDIGDPVILDRLRERAPLIAVRGNNDRGDEYAAVPATATLQLGAVKLHLLHQLDELQIDPVAGGVQIVVTGHSHKPLAVQREGVWYVNPGSAGPRRFSLPVSVALLRIDGVAIEVELLTLSI